jgi:PHD/YefM family antitoxin component YafN of YafNO toxin-antitoxin module
VPNVTISAGEARKDFFSLIERVTDDHAPVRINGPERPLP